jgi:hypothetical protein
MVAVDAMRPNPCITNTFKNFLLHKEVVQLEGGATARMPPRDVRGFFEEGGERTKLIDAQKLIESTTR